MGLVHGDISPKNIILVNDKPQIIDFGVCGIIGDLCSIEKGTFGYSFLCPSVFQPINDVHALSICVANFKNSDIVFNSVVAFYSNNKEF